MIRYILSLEDAVQFAAICKMAEGPKRTAALAAWVQRLYPEISLMPKEGSKPTPAQVRRWIGGVLP
jgi:hypothetical protein